MAGPKFIGSWLSAFVLLALLAGCGAVPPAPEPSGLLPADPQEWICKNSKPPANPAEIAAWYAAHPDRG